MCVWLRCHSMSGCLFTRVWFTVRYVWLSSHMCLIEHNYMSGSYVSDWTVIIICLDVWSYDCIWLLSYVWLSGYTCLDACTVRYVWSHRSGWTTMTGCLVTCVSLYCHRCQVIWVSVYWHRCLVVWSYVSGCTTIYVRSSGHMCLIVLSYMSGHMCLIVLSYMSGHVCHHTFLSFLKKLINWAGVSCTENIFFSRLRYCFMH